MNKLKIVFFLGVIFVACAFSTFAAKKQKYAIYDIPDELKENAYALVRQDSKTFTVKSIGKATLEIKYAITIFKSNGDEYADFVAFYDKLMKINDIKIKIYNAYGEVIENVKSGDIRDYSAVAGYSLYEDNRVKVYEPAVNTYPYTLEYEYSMDYDGLLHYPAWRPIFTYNLAVEKSDFTIKTPSGFKFRYKEDNLDERVSKNLDDENSTYTWSISNVKALQKLDFTPQLYQYTPVVYFAPNDFEIEGYAGNMENWNSFGKWFNVLNKGLDELPESTKAKLLELTKDEDTEVGKIQKVYEYMQERTRYVSIQVGIGGWRPFPASVVDDVGYGDCKALSMYMKSLLKVVGVESNYVLVKAKNDRNLNSDFPSTQFNHAILCVPLENDTIWLECTNQTIPFGFLGDFTDDRDVLLITEDGGKIAHTEVYGIKENTLHSITNVTISEAGTASSRSVTKYRGLQYEFADSYLTISREDQKKRLNKNIQLSNFEINDFSFSQKKLRIPEAVRQLDLTVKKYASVSGKRMFIPLNYLNRVTFIPEELENRNTNIHISTPYHDIDTVIYQLPENYDIEYMPADISFTSDFGEYSMKVYQEENKIYYIRDRKKFKGVFPPEKYEELRSFYKKIVKSDAIKLVLVKK